MIDWRNVLRGGGYSAAFLNDLPRAENANFCDPQVCDFNGGPNGNRTRVPDVRGRCPNR